MICAHVTALQRASKNRLVELFCALREANGWAIEWVSEKAPTAPYNVGKEMLEAERLEALLKAPLVDDADYIELDEKVSKGASLTKEESVTYERNHFERAIGIPLDEMLVGMNADGKLLRRVVNFARIISIWSSDNHGSLVDTLLEPTGKPKGRLQGTKPELLIAVLMRAAGMTTVNGIDIGGIVSVDTLTRFITICRDNRTVIEEVLGEPFRGDFKQKPVRQLNLFLKRTGLMLELAKIEKVAGHKIRYYAIPADMLGTMTRLARSYLAIEACKEQAKEEARLKRAQDLSDKRWEIVRRGRERRSVVLVNSRQPVRLDPHTGDNRFLPSLTTDTGLLSPRPPSPAHDFRLIVPTIANAGSPGATCTCTSTARASIPSKATVETR